LVLVRLEHLQHPLLLTTEVIQYLAQSHQSVEVEEVITVLLIEMAVMAVLGVGRQVALVVAVVLAHLVKVTLAGITLAAVAVLAL
jgi:hypothetical protein